MFLNGGPLGFRGPFPFGWELASSAVLKGSALLTSKAGDKVHILHITLIVPPN